MPIRGVRVSVRVALLAVAVIVVGCRPKAGPPPSPPPPTVTVVNPVTAPVQNYYEYNGHLEAVETVEVKARVKGLLQVVHFAEGEEVPQGARLYTIDPREYLTAVARATAELAKAAADIDNWKAQIKLAEADLVRANRNAATGAASQAEADRAKATVEVNVAQLAVSEANREAAAAALQTANIQLGYTDIRAPIAGRISRTLVTKGNLVGQDAPTLLTTIVSVDPVFVYFDAPERDLVEYQKALRTQSGSVRPVTATPVEVGVATEDGYPHPGMIDFRENRVDAGTGTVRVRGRLPNPPAEPTGARLLYAGLYARVRVPSGTPTPRPLLPEDALMTGQEGRFVYVLGPNDVVERRTVTVGTRVWQAPPPGDNALPGWALAHPNPPPAPPNAPPPPTRLPLRAVVAIEKGLSADDRVIVNGLQKARTGAPVAPDVWELRPPANGK